MENESEEIVDQVSGITTDTVCEHFFVEAVGDPNSNLSSATCSKCWHGASYDSEQFSIIEGKLTSNL